MESFQGSPASRSGLASSPKEVATPNAEGRKYCGKSHSRFSTDNEGHGKSRKKTGVEMAIESICPEIGEDVVRRGKVSGETAVGDIQQERIKEEKAKNRRIVGKH